MLVRVATRAGLFLLCVAAIPSVHAQSHCVRLELTSDASGAASSRSMAHYCKDRSGGWSKSGPKQARAADFRPIVQGKHFTALETPLATRAANDRVEIAVFFWYACRECHEYDIMMHWLSDAPSNVELVLIPVAWHAMSATHAKAFYIAESLGKRDAMHHAFFTEIQDRRKPLTDKAELAAFFERYGVGQGQFDDAWNSDQLALRQTRDSELVRKLGVNSVPLVVVNGKYAVTPKSAGGDSKLYRGMIEVVDALAVHEAGIASGSIRSGGHCAEERATDTAAVRLISPGVRADCKHFWAKGASSAGLRHCELAQDTDDVALKIGLLSECLRTAGLRDAYRAEMLQYRGVAIRKAGDLNRALVDLRRSIRMDPTRWQTYASRAYAFLDLDQSKRALDDFNAALDIDPDNANLLVSRGSTYLRLDDTTEGIRDLDRAIRIEPGYSTAYFFRALAHSTDGDDERAIADYTSAIQLDAGNWEALVNRGVILAQQGELERALADFNAALRINPGRASTRKARDAVRKQLRTKRR